MRKRFRSRGLILALFFSISVFALVACKGATGPSGGKGDAGSQGSAGVAGQVGPSGAEGDKGDAGPRGAAGARGGSGSAGSAGPPGPPGPQGPAGRAGSAGSAGPIGPAGPAGFAGPPGLPGAQGPAGGGAALVVNPVEPDGDTIIWGAGFQPNESVSISAIAASGGQDMIIVGDRANASGAFQIDATINLETGVYTLMAVGDQDTVAVTPLLVASK